MPQQRRKGTKNAGLVALAWGLNIVGLLAMAVVGIAWLALRPAHAAPGPADGLNAPPIIPTITTAPDGVYFLPTVTSNPRATLIVPMDTPTPFVLAGGNRATVIGYSVSGRPIEVYTFGNGPNQRMIVAGIHGGYEWNTIALADELILHINENPEIIPDDVTLYILRNLNPDGDARFHGIDGRVNDHGVDLNRNFPTNWAETWDRDGCWNYAPTTGGTGPGSEPETRALMNFLMSHKVQALISYHSAALGVFPGGEPWEANSMRFAEQLAAVTKYSYPPIDTGCKFTGTLADYAVELGAVSVDMELATHKYTDFSRNVKALDVLLNWEN
jgi:hypothetical protein